jgi:UPF0755 protein
VVNNGKIFHLQMNLIAKLHYKSIIHFLIKRKFFFISAIVVIWFLSYLMLPLNVTEENASFEISAGKSLGEITDQLVEIKVLQDSFRFKLLTFLFGKAEKLKKGHYQLSKDITPYELLEMLATGRESLFSLTLIEGQTYHDLVATLGNNKHIKKTLKTYNKAEVLKAIHANTDYIEGIFFPDSYYFYKNSNDIDILKNAHKVMVNKLSFLWENRTGDLPYTDMYDALIMASIIEKEILIKDEAPMVAGVFINRLNMGMPLQSDPTVIFGMRENFDGNLRRKDLKKDTSHNTYTRRGLPPTPIAYPSQSSLEAALNPATTDALYFVAMGDGRHYFSRTLKEHNWAVRKYQKKK